MATASSDELKTKAGFQIYSVLTDGLVAGGLAGLVVMSIFTVADLIAGELLLTPSVLYAYVWHGPENALEATPNVEQAISYASLHMAVWIGFGIVAAAFATIAEQWPPMGRRLSGLLLALVCAAIALVPAVRIPGLEMPQLWAGSIAGTLILVGWVIRRHPDSVRHETETEH